MLYTDLFFDLLLHSTGKKLGKTIRTIFPSLHVVIRTIFYIHFCPKKGRKKALNVCNSNFCSKKILLFFFPIVIQELRPI